MGSHWSDLHECIYHVAEEALGFAKCKHPNWFNENDTAAIQLLDRLLCAHLDYVNDKTFSSKKDNYHVRQVTQVMLCNMKDQWWLDRAEDLQAASDRHDMKAFYDGLKVVYGPLSKGSTPLYSADGEPLIRDEGHILACCVELFEHILNRESVK